MTRFGRTKQSAARESAVWLSFLAFLLVFLGLGGVLVFRDMPTWFGYDVQKTLTGIEALGAAACSIILIILLFYLAAIAWMLFARLLFSRAEVSVVVFHGLATRFDRWLLDKLFPDEAG